MGRENMEDKRSLNAISAKLGQPLTAEEFEIGSDRRIQLARNRMKHRNS